MLAGTAVQHSELSAELCDGLGGGMGGWGQARAGGDVCGHIAGSLRCTAETNQHCKATVGSTSVAQSRPTPVAPWTVAHQAPLSTGFSRQEY